MRQSAFYFELDVWTARSRTTADTLRRRVGGELRERYGSGFLPGLVSFLLTPQRFSSHWLLHVSVGTETPLWVRREPKMPYSWVNEVTRGNTGNWMLCDQVYGSVFFSIEDGNAAVPCRVLARSGIAYLSLDKELVRYAKVSRVVEVPTQVESDPEIHERMISATNQLAEKIGLYIS